MCPEENRLFRAHSVFEGMRRFETAGLGQEADRKRSVWEQCPGAGHRFDYGLAQRIPFDNRYADCREEAYGY